MAGFGSSTLGSAEAEILAALGLPSQVFASGGPPDIGAVMQAIGLSGPPQSLGLNIPKPSTQTVIHGSPMAQAPATSPVEGPPIIPGPPGVPQPPPPARPPGAQPLSASPTPATVEGSPTIPPSIPPGILAALGMYPPEDMRESTPAPAPGTVAGQMVAPPMPGNSGVAPTVEPPEPVFPGDSMLQNPAIPLPSSGRPPSGVGAGGGSAPRIPSTPGAGPTTTPADLGPSSSQSSTAGRAADAGRGASRLMDTLAVIGAVLSQPPPPGGNIVSQIGKAMGLGFAYNKMLDSAEVEQGNVVRKQELEARNTAVREKQVGIQDKRVDQQGRLVDIEERKAPVEIELLRERVRGTAAESRMREIELRYKNDPARRELELQKLATEVDRNKATTEYTRSQVDTPAHKNAAAIAKALKDSGAIDPMNPAGINWQAAAPVYSTFGHKALNANEVAQAKAQFQKLVQGGMSAIEAERQINLWLTSPERKRVPISLATPTR